MDVIYYLVLKTNLIIENIRELHEALNITLKKINKKINKKKENRVWSVDNPTEYNNQGK